jgi:CDP-diacylglycerol--serine O-phosphatidyltransferase
MRQGRTINQDSMKKGIYILPNLFTTASMFCGFYAVIASMNGLFSKAAVAIMISCVLDGLDGKIARFTNTTSKFGIEYDSLSDLIAFGVAPAVLAYGWALSPYGRYGWLAAFLFVACGALRLARFNIQIGVINSRVFNGLPIPAAAVVVATSVLFYYYIGGEGNLYHPSLIIFMTILALLMVSNIKYYSFKDLDFFARKPFMTFFLIVCLFVVVVIEPQIMFFAFAIGYCLSGPGWTLYRLVKKRAEKREYKHKNI